MSTTVTVKSTHGRPQHLFEKTENNGRYENKGRPVNCLIIAFKQAMSVKGACVGGLSASELRAQMAAVVLDQEPSEDSYKLHASLLLDGDAGILYGKLPSELEYLERASRYLSTEQIRELETLPTTVGRRLEIATKLLKPDDRITSKRIQFNTKAMRLQHVMGLLDESQQQQVLASEKPCTEQRLKHALKYLTPSQKKSVYELDKIDDRLKSLVKYEILNEMLTWEVFRAWTKTADLPLNIVLCSHLSGQVYECENNNAFDPQKRSIFIARKDKHFEALSPIDDGRKLEDELCRIDGWRISGVRRIGETSIEIFTSKVDETTVMVHIMPQNILRLMPPSCDFIRQLARVKGTIVEHRYDQEVCDELYVSGDPDRDTAAIFHALR